MSGFIEIIKTQMENKGISEEQLCEGLCSQSMFVKICNGERGAYNYKAQYPSDYDEKIWRAEVQKSAMLFHIMKFHKLENKLEKILKSI